MLFLLIPFLSKSQCGFDVVRQKQLLDPAFVLQEQANELKIKNFVPNVNTTAKAAIINIPVVVHVLHKGEAVGSGTNISDAQIQSSIDRLNDVYRGLDPNSPVDFEIQFTLAQRDPNCLATNGINRVNASGVPGYSADGVFLQSTGADENTLKDLSRWPETDYFNIWIVSEIDGNNGGSGIQGYANFYNGNAYEGSVMMYTVFGYDPTSAQPSWPLTFSRDNSTPIHEFGHYFHLYHTFQGDNDDTTCPGDAVVGTDSDGCADTETHKRHTSTCPTNNDCNGNNPYGLNTRNNYMSYFSCTDRLTADQKTRVTAAMTGTAIASSRGDEAPVTVPNIVAASCTPTSTNVFFSSGVINVELNGFNVTSGGAKTDNNPNGYLDNSGDCNKYFSINADIPNSMDVTVGNNASNHRLGVWIDWNNDGDFDDSNEQQHISSGNPTSSVINVPLIYPASISYDSSVRLRVVSDLDGGPVVSSCGNPTYGQAEDYKIYIEPAAGSAPVADFSASATTVCKGSTVNFTDLSTNTPTSWSWSFAGGTPSSSTSQNPSITYNAAGTYSVTLTATNAFGSDPETKTNYITVNDLPDLSSTSSDDETCAGNDGTATVTPAPVGSYTYSWTTAPVQTTATATGLAAGSYNVTVTNTATTCFASTGVTVVDGCAPAGPSIFATHCSRTLTSLKQYTNCYSVPGATQYEFELLEVGTSNSIGSRVNYVPYFAIFQIPNWEYSTTYDLRARAKVGGDWSNYGTVCEITTPSQPNTVNMYTPHCGRVLSSPSQFTLCDQIAGATQYEFQILEVGTGSLVSSRINYVNYVAFSQFTGWATSTNYDIKARAYVNGSWTLFGSTCQVTSPASSILDEGEVAYYRIVLDKELEDQLSISPQLSSSSFKIYPNPNQGEYLFVELQDLSPNSQIIVSDVYGKTIQNIRLETEDVNYNTTVKFDEKLKPGFYLITVLSNGQSSTQKLIVK